MRCFVTGNRPLTQCDNREPSPLVLSYGKKVNNEMFCDREPSPDTHSRTFAAITEHRPLLLDPFVVEIVLLSD
jgi:hypothetical protein